MDTYPRCATCKHWEYDEAKGDVELRGKCVRLTEEDANYRTDMLVLYSGGEYYMATRYDFGCVLHETKE